MYADRVRLISHRPSVFSQVCAFLCLLMGVGSAQLAWSGSLDHPPAKLATPSNPARVQVPTASFAAVTVHNVRAFSSAGKTRLVLDLNRRATVIEQQAQNPARTVISLPNAELSQPARAKVVGGAIPALFNVSETLPQAVTVSLPTASFRTYKQFTLADPPRLVIDVTSGSDQDEPPFYERQERAQPAPPPIIQPSAPRQKGYITIVIDPGHGGKDPGARGLQRTAEKDITLKIALQLRQTLSKQPNIRVLMTRERDAFVELEDRTKFANSNEADLFISIHVNSNPSRLVKGIEIYHFGEAKDQRALELAARENGTPISSTGVGWEYLVADLLTTKKFEASLELAWNAKEAMVTRMHTHYAVSDHGVKTAPFYVLRFTSMPSILAEVAYLSNPTEEDLLQNPAFIKDVAYSLSQGITSFLASTK